MIAVSPLWEPDQERIENARLTEFSRQYGPKVRFDRDGFGDLHQWSVNDPDAFWTAVWDYCGIVGERGDRVVQDGEKMPGAKFFPDAHLSFAENMLQQSGDETAIHFRGEDKVSFNWSFDELRSWVSRLQQGFKSLGVRSGDRIAAMVPNRPETVACMLAANSLGAIWSSCSPDFGVQGVLDRFGQIEPKLFIACDGYWYNGKAINVSEKVENISGKLAPDKTLVMSYLSDAATVAARAHNGETLDSFAEKYQPAELEFERLPFSHPLYILFSSGTTGIPKCIVHSQGGTLIQHLKEHVLHCGLGVGDNVFYFTTCGWMMWNWLVSALAAGSTLILFDGSPFAPSSSVLFDYADEVGINFFGTSAKFIDAVRNSGLEPKITHSLASVKTIASTGSPLAPENFSFVYSGIKDDVHLASVSGGTDIVACFVGAVPWAPVYVGEIQGPMLGMASDVWDEAGQSMSSGKGELVCHTSFPTMPIGFWNDEGDRKYHAAYFDRFENVWCHGDFAEWTPRGGMIIHGRSDATLNPGGVRIGTAEIYNQVEQMGEIEEALCIGQDWQDDTRVVLFVRLAEGVMLDDELTSRIKLKIRTGASPRHVPAVIVEVTDIPRTKSGKITELAVRDVVHGREVKNKEAMANPESLELFRNLPELAK